MLVNTFNFLIMKFCDGPQPYKIYFLSVIICVMWR